MEPGRRSAAGHRSRPGANADGYLWIGTDEGLARFDGYEFTPFSRRSGALPSNTVLGLDVASDGALWASTPTGLVRYKDGAFRTLTRATGCRSLWSLR